MSYGPTAFRPLARGGWGGRASSHWRGAQGLATGTTPLASVAGAEPLLWGQIGTVIYRSKGVTVNYAIAGVSRDSGGAALAGCVIDLFTTGSDALRDSQVSNASGNFSFAMPGTGPFYIVAYKAGGTDVAGTTVNTLIPV